MCDLILGETAMRKFVIFVVTISATLPVRADVTMPPGTCSVVAVARYSDCSQVNVVKCTGEKAPLYRYEAFSEGEIFTLTWDEASDIVTFANPYDDADGAVLRLGGHRLAEALAAGSMSFVADGDLTIMGMTKPFSAKADYRYEGKATISSEKDLTLVDAIVWLKPPPPMEDMVVELTIARDPATGLSVPQMARISGEAADNDPTLELLSYPGEPGFKPEFDASDCQLLGSISAKNEGFVG
jgi:hypothetical protein